jgi:hypothetical protein
LALAVALSLPLHYKTRAGAPATSFPQPLEPRTSPSSRAPPPVTPLPPHHWRPVKKLVATTGPGHAPDPLSSSRIAAGVRVVWHPLALPDRAAQVAAAVIFNLRPPSSISFYAASRAPSFPLRVSRQGEDPSRAPVFSFPVRTSSPAMCLSSSSAAGRGSPCMSPEPPPCNPG